MAIITREFDYEIGPMTFDGALAVDDAHKGPRPTVIVCHGWEGRSDAQIEVAAEPIEFELAANPALGGPFERARLLQRFPLPIFGRCCRAVPAGGTETYRLVVPLASEAVGAVAFRVVGASFFKGPIPTKCPVIISTLEYEKFRGSDDRTIGRFRPRSSALRTTAIGRSTSPFWPQ